ncbi:erythromycin esterase family protein [Streptomyces sp. NPDC059477]|uniref:erythromycin esterase family protein n=1 Tax=Streptomyces sp. NPDC059477 TaxID=3346847 RepID=UPI00369D4FCB
MPASNPRTPRLRTATLLSVTAITLLTSLALAAPPTPAYAADRPGHATPAPDTTTERRVIAAIDQRAKPLRTTRPDAAATADLTALARMTKDATVVGVGEATHGSRELFQLKDRLFRHLVQREGFRVFALEMSWSAGTRIDAYVRTGEGDLRQIMREEFQGPYGDWNNEEFLALFSWMRAYNTGAPADDQVRVMGNDIGDVHRSQYDRILAWAAENRPDLTPDLHRRYAGLLALPDSMNERMATLSNAPMAERRAYDADAKAAYQALESAGDTDPWVLQEARMITQMTTMYTYDVYAPDQQAAINLHRDRAMAENTVWWQRRTGDRVLASAHNAHLAYESPNPESHPVMEGAFLRDLIGDEYLAIGTSIHSGAYRAMNTVTGQYEVFDTGRAAPGSNEHTLDRARLRDYYVDLRTLADHPKAGPWLATPRPTFVVPGSHPNEPEPVALSRSFDILIHLHRVNASVPLP